MRSFVNAAGVVLKPVGYRMRSRHWIPPSTRTVDNQPGPRSCGARAPGAAPNFGRIPPCLNAEEGENFLRERGWEICFPQDKARTSELVRGRNGPK